MAKSQLGKKIVQLVEGIEQAGEAIVDLAIEANKIKDIFKKHEDTEKRD